MKNLKLGLAIMMVALLSLTASADVVRNVTATEGPDWVKIDIHGAHNYNVKHLPPGSADYRSIAIDVPGYIAGGLEPKAALPVDFGLVGQVRVRQLTGSTVRVYVDVINWPDYDVVHTGSGVQLRARAFKLRRSEPAAMY